MPRYPGGAASTGSGGTARSQRVRVKKCVTTDTVLRNVAPSPSSWYSSRPLRRTSRPSTLFPSRTCAGENPSSGCPVSCRGCRPSRSSDRPARSPDRIARARRSSPPPALRASAGSRKCDVGLVQRLAVDVDDLSLQLERFAGQPDHPLDEVAVRLLRVLEDDHVAAPDRRRSAAASARARSAVGANTNLLTSR